MGIGTSHGAYYDDEFHRAAAGWDPKYDENKSGIQNAVDNTIHNFKLNFDDDAVKNPLEIDPNEHSDRSMSPDTMMRSKNINKDTGNIYDDSGQIVDYDHTGMGPTWGTSDLPTNGPADFNSRFGDLPPSGIMNDLKPTPDAPLLRHMQ